MSPQSRLERYEQRTEWPLVAVALTFLRPLRLLSLAVVINALQRAVGHTIRGRVLVYTACGAVAIVYAASLAILDVEGNRPEKHSEIDTLGDALWWAMTTVTTVGYGDLKPVSAEGRLVAVALMIGGITLLGSITATLASWIVQRVSEKDQESQAATAAQIEALHAAVRRLADYAGETGGVTGKRMKGS